MASTKEALLENSNGGAEEEEEERASKVGCWNKVLDVEEAKIQILFSIPMILTNVAYFSIPLISSMFAGHLGELELAGATLANSSSCVTGLSLMTGLSGALETLCGHAYGAKLYRKMGIYLQASVITTIFFAILVSFIWFYSEPILILLHQDPQVAKMASIFLRHLIPGLFAYAIIQSILRFLQTQTVVLPLVICSLIPMAIHIVFTYVLVYHTVLGFKGAALSASLSLWISAIMLAAYVHYSEKFKHTWQGVSMECFQYVLPGMKFAIPSALMVCLEYWAFEALVIVAGLMPNSETSTSLIAICVNTETIAYMFTYGFSAAASNIWASAFSNSAAIKKEFASMTPFLVVSITFDAAQGVLGGVLRGCGLQHLAAWTNLAAFYVIGMPIAIVLAFVAHLYAKGLWIGLVSALFSQACILFVITMRTNWTQMELSVRDDIKKNENMLV